MVLNFDGKSKKMSKQLYRIMNCIGQMLFRTQNAGIVQHLSVSEDQYDSLVETTDGLKLAFDLALQP